MKDQATPDEIRANVSRHYADAITAQTGCCGGGQSKCCTPPAAMGYESGALTDVPEAVAGSSFGCGNPLAFADVKAGQTVLDLGAGAGLDLILAAKAVGPDGHVIGVDMTPEMIKQARANIERAGFSNVEVREGLIESLPVESGTVDWVISNCVINLSPDKPKVFAEIARVLRPGGRMRVSDIVVKDLPAWVFESEMLYSTCIAGAISEEDYVAGLERAGLVDVEVVERVVYEAGHLRAFRDRDRHPEITDEMIAEVDGKAWSGLFVARKPG